MAIMMRKMRMKILKALGSTDGTLRPLIRWTSFAPSLTTRRIICLNCSIRKLFSNRKVQRTASYAAPHSQARWASTKIARRSTANAVEQQYAVCVLPVPHAGWVRSTRRSTEYAMSATHWCPMWISIRCIRIAWSNRMRPLLRLRGISPRETCKLSSLLKG